jgi:WD40 repeat protein
VRLPFTDSCEDDVMDVVDSPKSDRFAIIHYRRKLNPRRTSDGEVLTTIRVFDKTGRVLYHRDNLPAELTSLSPDGTHLVVVVKDQQHNTTLELHEINRTGNDRSLFIDGVSSAAAVAPYVFSSDGRYLAIGMSSGDIRFYRMATDIQEIHGDDLPRHYAPITSLAFANATTQDGPALLAVADAEQIVRVWKLNLRSPGPRGLMLWSDNFGRPVSQLTFSPTDRYVGLAVGEKTTRVKLALTGFETVRVTQTDPRLSSLVKFIQFSPDERFAFSASEPISEAGSGELIRVPVHQADPPAELEFSQCQAPRQVSLSGDAESIVAVCQVLPTPPPPLLPIFNVHWFPLKGSPAPSGQPLHTGHNCDVAVSTDGSFAATECDSAIKFFDLFRGRSYDFGTPSILQIGGRPNPVRCDDSGAAIALSTNGSALAIGNRCGGVAVYEINKGYPSLSNMTFDYEPQGEEYDPTVSRGITALAFSGDSRLIAAGASNGVLWVRKTDDPATALYKSQFEGVVSSIQFGPIPSNILLYGVAGTVGAIDLRNGHLLQNSHNDSNVRAVTFSPDGRRVAAGYSNGALYVYDLPDCYVNSARGCDYKDWKQWTIVNLFGYDTRTILEPADTFLGDRPRNLYSVRLLANNQFFVASDHDQLLAKGERNPGQIPFLSVTMHDLNLSERPRKLCGQLRRNITFGELTYALICGRATPEGSK